MGCNRDRAECLGLFFGSWVSGLGSWVTGCQLPRFFHAVHSVLEITDDRLEIIDYYPTKYWFLWR